MMPDQSRRSLAAFRACHERFQFPGLGHFADDVTTANQFSVDPQLGEGWPVGILRQIGSDVGIAQHIHVGKFLTAGHEGLHGARGKSALGLVWGPLHVKDDAIAFDLFANGVHNVHCVLPRISGPPR